MQQNIAVLEETIYTDCVIRFHPKLELLSKVMVTLKIKVRIWNATL